MPPRAASRQGQVAHSGQRQAYRGQPQDNRQPPQDVRPPPGTDQPLPPWPISDNKWFVLTQDVGPPGQDKTPPKFARGTLVLITGHVFFPQSPTNYPGQPIPSAHTRENTLYRIKKLEIIKTRTFETSDAQSRLITPNKLSLVKGGRGHPDASFEQGQLVYVVDDIPRVRAYGTMVEIKRNTRAMVVGSTSRAGAGKVPASHGRHATGRPYILQFAFEETSHDWVPCRSAVPADALQEATEKEVTDFYGKLEDAPIGWKLVDSSEADIPQL